MSLAQRLEDAPFSFGPIFDSEVVATRAHTACSEEVAVFDDSDEVIQDIGSVIHEVSYFKFFAVDGLLRPLSAESNMVLVYSNFIEELVKSEPLLCPFLDSGSAFRYDPYPTL